MPDGFDVTLPEPVPAESTVIIYVFVKVAVIAAAFVIVMAHLAVLVWSPLSTPPAALHVPRQDATAFEFAVAVTKTSVPNRNLAVSVDLAG
jgi:hypothetical protein